MNVQKNRIGALLLTLIICALVTNTATAALPAARWKMDDNAASAVVLDSAGGHHGTFMDASGDPQTGFHHRSDCREGTGSLAFDGADDYAAAAGYKGITGTGGRTCMAWIKTSGSASNMVILNWGATVSGQQWLFGIFSTGKLTVYAGGPYIQTHATVTDGQWHHVAAVLDDNGSPVVNDIKLYIDGMLEATTSSSGTAAVNTVSGPDVLVGGFEYAAGQVGFFFPGLLDDVRMYDAALSAEEIYRIVRPEYAFAVFPAPGATGVGADRDLAWSAGQHALSHDVYFGASQSAVAAAQRLAGDINGDGPVDIVDLMLLAEQWLTDPGAVNVSADIVVSGRVDSDDFAVLADDWLAAPNAVFKGNQTGLTFDPGPLAHNTTYYWRIDEVNPAHTDSPWTGPVWSFTTKGSLTLGIPNLSPAAYTPQYDTLNAGSVVYSDRTYTFVSVPLSLQGETYIQTANGDKESSAGSFLVFDINQDCTVYVAHDDSITTKPSWLSAFTDTGDNLVTSDGDKVFSLYRKDFIAGTVTLGGNGGGGTSSMYSVVVAGKGTVTTGGKYDLYSDTWVAVDALSRALPDYAQCGPQRDNRTVALFYYIWLGQHDGTIGPYDVTKILAANPINPAWGPAGVFHHWGESELGYYRSEDPYVIRRHAHLLADAGVDVIVFDVTNGPEYESNYKALCSVYRQIRSEGGKTPQICFFANYDADTKVQNIYNHLYSQNLYPELWFYWKGKPLILSPLNGMADPAGGTISHSSTITNFFAMRYSWTWMNVTQADVWKWMDYYPQQYGWHESSSIPEQISVSCGIVPHTNQGRSYNTFASPAQPPHDLYGLSGTQDRGFCFAQQWTRLYAIDPELLFITQWNEWIAERQIAEDGRWFLGEQLSAGDTWFIDEYNQEYSRDIEPMKGGHTDNYYYQMIDGIRKYKGVKQRAAASAPATITIDGDFSDWVRVGPEYRDNKGDTTHRNYPGWGAAGTYTNFTGRNDIVASRVAQDDAYVYFYVETAAAITSYTGSAWMLLLINADQDHVTGWEGYDYIVNLAVNSTTGTTLKYTAGGWNWTDVNTDIPYRVAGNKMELRIPRSDLGQSSGGDPVAFDFKWADNLQKTDDIIEFSISGDSAPDRRFNYRYETAPWTLLTYADFEAGWGSFNDGGTNCTRYDDGKFAHQGVWAANIQSGSTSSQFTSNTMNVSAYSQITIEFWYYAVSLESGENFRVEYDNGSGSFQTLATYTSGTHFNNNEFNRGRITIEKGPYVFPTNARFRFRCYAGDSGDDVYIDEVKISVK